MTFLSCDVSDIESKNIFDKIRLEMNRRERKKDTTKNDKKGANT